MFIHFSYLDGYPSTVLEAYTTRTPVVANDAVGMSEQVIDGETGYLVDLNDPDGVASRLNDLLDSPAKRKMLGDAGYEQVESNNTTTQIGEQLRTYLSNIL